MNIDLSINEKEISIIIENFIKTYVKNSGIKSIVLGLSGGVDSAVTALLCIRAIGKKNVKCLFLPDDTTPSLDNKHFKLLVEKKELSYSQKDISRIIKGLSNSCIRIPDKYAIANIKARIRMIMLYEYTNMTKSLVCGTSNKSEILVGYFTKYGDGGVDIMPIGDLYKTQVSDLARYLKIPKEIISKPPTAGLWKSQFDEIELKISYKTLDVILAGLEKKIDINDIAKIAEVKKSDVERIKNMRVRNQHKSRSPLIPKIGIRTPGYDWRSPILIG